MDQKTVVHLHNGILRSREKEGAPTLQDSMDGTGEHYAKWSMSGNEIQMLYDLTYKWNLINTTKKQAKYSQRHWNWEQADSDQRGEGRGKGWRVYKNNYKRHMDNNKVGVETGEGGEEGWGEKVENCTWTKIFKKLGIKKSDWM